MLMTLLATIGLVFIILAAYKRGKREGIKEAVDFFVAEMERKSIDIRVIDDIEQIEGIEAPPELSIRKRITRLIGKLKTERCPDGSKKPEAGFSPPSKFKE
ncbi:MAG: hypothetical protein FVQ81_05060 [Candidatus Glassbacteria bacterium]|nr:hypothetical protein [Candidatus Glassbacteria bacterium]